MFKKKKQSELNLISHSELSNGWKIFNISIYTLIPWKKTITRYALKKKIAKKTNANVNNSNNNNNSPAQKKENKACKVTNPQEYFSILLRSCRDKIKCKKPNTNQNRPISQNNGSSSSQSVSSTATASMDQKKKASESNKTVASDLKKDFINGYRYIGRFCEHFIAVHGVRSISATSYSSSARDNTAEDLQRSMLLSFVCTALKTLVAVLCFTDNKTLLMESPEYKELADYTVLINNLIDEMKVYRNKYIRWTKKYSWDSLRNPSQYFNFFKRSILLFCAFFFLQFILIEKKYQN